MVVGGDEQLGVALSHALQRRGLNVLRARSGAAALQQLRPGTDLVLLDIALPDMDALTVCRRVRRAADAAIIMTAGSSGVSARIRGLEAGADDFVTRPFDVREMVARIEAVLRRRQAGRVPDEPKDRVEVRGIAIDVAAHKVRLTNGRLARLTRMEFELLAALARRDGAVVTRESLLHEVWGSGWKGLERSLEVHVSSIRRKLGVPGVVETVRGVGYRLGTEG
ncbi:winged helix-turn-helix domain-containing protein [Georgenia alba]|uniref:Sensory transduction protein RegX3 n=1 Tax=Georgenia alba TaxID=2233858 RepID=A0ABW2Q4T9_9MICO